MRLIIGKDWTVRVISDGPIVPPETLAGLTGRYVHGDTRAGLVFACARPRCGLCGQGCAALRILAE